jgi:RND family efflux transporter MFP subunit
MNHIYLCSLLSLLLISCASGCSGHATANAQDEPITAGPPLERVIVGKPARKILRLTTTQPGRVAAFEETPLYSKLAGYVDEVLVDIGDRVKKDQPLVRLWVPELVQEARLKESLVLQAISAIDQAKASLAATEASATAKTSQVAEAEAGLARAEAQLERWNAELARMTQLAASDSVTQRLVDETRNQHLAAAASRDEASAKIESARAELAHSRALVERATADVAAAEAELQVARADWERTRTMLGYAEIRAPYDGIVTARNVDTRHFVQPAGGANNAPLVAVACSDKVRVSVDLPELEAGFLNRGDAATVRVQALANREFSAGVARDAWSLHSMNRSLKAEVDLANDDGALRPGMYALVTIVLEEAPESLVLPASSILRDGDETYVMVVDAGVVRKRRIETGLRSGQEIQITSGLSPDDAVVLNRGESLADGQPVEVVPSK